jgi:uncharacterized damage-inducible protein DinB
MAANLTPLIKAALIGELEQLHAAVRQLAESISPQELWKRPIEPGNSVGHLILHLTGNLSHYVGGQLGKTGYVRDREREFTEAQPPTKTELLAGLDAAVATFRRVVEELDADQLAAAHPEARFGSVLQALVHLVSHFALHRGQMSYIARLVRPA